MDPVPVVVPISELRQRLNELLEQASDQPIALTRDGQAVAVLIGPESYSRLLEHIEDLQLAIDAIDAREAGEPPTDLNDDHHARGDDQHIASGM